MISRAPLVDRVAVTFHLDVDFPVSVVGDFNSWDPLSDPLTPLAGGMRSRTIELAPGTYAFRYLADGGHFFDADDADAVEHNGIGGTHSLLVVSLAEVVAPATNDGEDELERIEGIGPKIAAALRSSGITTFARLSTAGETELRASLSFAGIRLAPSVATWGEQARLLAAGNEAGFLKLTNQLVAGRKATK
jgi:Helix-hairpin-helix domain